MNSSAFQNKSKSRELQQNRSADTQGGTGGSARRMRGTRPSGPGSLASILDVLDVRRHEAAMRERRECGDHEVGQPGHVATAAGRPSEEAAVEERNQDLDICEEV